MTSVLFERVDDIERRFRGLERELHEVRSLLGPAPAPVVAPSPVQASRPTRSQPPVQRIAGPIDPLRSQVEPVLGPPPRVSPPSPSSPPKPPSGTAGELLEAWDLLGARGLALVGGAVTLLGIAFFFVLAANHGWIGPVARVTLGGVASALVFGSGLVLRHRYGQLHAALAAVGTGVAGGYTTLLATAAIYHLVPEPVALAIAAGIAGAAVAVAILWSSEIVAGLGLLGAAAVPALHALDGTLSASAVEFVVLVFAAAIVVSLHRRWPALLAATAVATVAQTLWLFLVANTGDEGAIAVGAALVGLLLVAALGLEQVSHDGLGGLAESLAVGAAGIALVGSLTIFGSATHAGIALLIAAAAVAAACVVGLWISRNLATVLGGLALALAAVGTADLLSSRSLTIVWAAESIVLTGVGVRLRERRFRLAALAYVPLALVHALAVEAPPGRLFEDAAAGYVHGVPSVAAVALAAGLAGWRNPKIQWIARAWPVVRATLAGIAALLVLDATSLLLVEGSFGVGHLVVTGLWAVVGLAVVVLGARMRRHIATTAGFAWLAVSFVKTVAFDWAELGHEHGAVSLIAVAVPILLAGVALRVLDGSSEPLGFVAAVCGSVALVSFVVAVDVLVSGDRAFGAAMLAPAALFVALAAVTFPVPRLRNLATILWAHGLVGLLIAEAALIQGRGSAAAYALTAAAVAMLAVRTRERRLFIAAATVLGATTIATIGFLTTPDRLVHASEHPGVSLWVLVICIASGAVLAFCDRTTRTWVTWISAALAVYALSLGILDLAERISPASIATDFQRGHTVVTAFWGLIGLGLLIVGLVRRLAPLRLAGLAVFGFALAKLFLYDLSALSSVTRAVSFLAVGAFMLAGGFFLQRLSARLERL